MLSDSLRYDGSADGSMMSLGDGKASIKSFIPSISLMSNESNIKAPFIHKTYPVSGKLHLKQNKHRKQHL